MKIKTINQISVQEWDKVVKETYNKPYSLQQQNGCYENGSIVNIEVPNEEEDYENDTTPERLNTDEMVVSFRTWLDSIQPPYKWEVNLWWERNFYPSIHVLANDLYKKGILPQGEYQILIEW